MDTAPGTESKNHLRPSKPTGCGTLGKCLTSLGFSVLTIK